MKRCDRLPGQELAFRRLIVFAVLLGVTANVGCYASGGGETTGEDNDQSTVAVEDLLGRTVTVPREVQRIVAIGPGALRMVTYVDGADRVAGIEQFEINQTVGRPYMEAYPELADLPIIGSGGPSTSIDPERIIAVEPDVIVTAYHTDRSAADALQQRVGYPVLAVAPAFGAASIFDPGLIRSIELLGHVLNRTERSTELVAFLNETAQDLHERTANIPADRRPSVYVGAIGSRGTHGITSTQADYSLLQVVHGANVVDELDTSGPVMIDMEQLLTWDPDIIFIDRAGLGHVINDYRRNTAFYGSLSAFASGSVHGLLPYNFYSTNTGTAIIDAYYIGKTIYPDQFTDIDIPNHADRVYTMLLGAELFGQMTETLGKLEILELNQ